MSLCSHNPLAMSLLTRLSSMADKAVAGVRSRKPALTIRDLDEYRKTRSMTAREGFESAITRVEQTGAIALHWDEPNREGLINRVELINAELLANALGRTPYAKLLAQAKQQLQQATDNTVLANNPLWPQIIDMWERCKRVRGVGAEDIEQLVMAIKAVLAAKAAMAASKQERTLIPLRALSRQLYEGGSKQLEKLYSLVDLILVEDIEAEARSAEEVWQELGILKETQPIRLAGRISISRGRLAGLIDAPYGAYDPETVFAVESDILAVLSVENQTNFHALAREMAEQPILLLYTAGMPSPAWSGAYTRLLASVPDSTPVLHWGDIDEGGFRIAARLTEEASSVGCSLQPFLMHPADIPDDIKVDKAAPNTVRLMTCYAKKAGWMAMTPALEKAKLTLEQEAFLLQSSGGTKSIVQKLLTLV